jgi:hypothetical protein
MNACLAHPVLYITNVDIKEWARITAMYVHQFSNNIMPFPWHSQLWVMPIKYAMRIEKILKPCPWASTWDEFLTKEPLLEQIMHKRDILCPPGALRTVRQKKMVPRHPSS